MNFGSGVGNTSVGNNAPSQELMIKQAFDRLYERSPLPQLLQSQYGNSPKKRFSGKNSVTPSNRINQIYESLKTSRNQQNTSISQSDFSDNSFSYDAESDTQEHNRSTQSPRVFKYPRYPDVGCDRSFERNNTQFPGRNTDNYYEEQIPQRCEGERDQDACFDQETSFENYRQYTGNCYRGENSFAGNHSFSGGDLVLEPRTCKRTPSSFKASRTCEKMRINTCEQDENYGRKNIPASDSNGRRHFETPTNMSSKHGRYNRWCESPSYNRSHKHCSDMDGNQKHCSSYDENFSQEDLLYSPVIPVHCPKQVYINDRFSETPLTGHDVFRQPNGFSADRRGNGNTESVKINKPLDTENKKIMDRIATDIEQDHPGLSSQVEGEREDCNHSNSDVDLLSDSEEKGNEEKKHSLQDNSVDNLQMDEGQHSEIGQDGNLTSNTEEGRHSNVQDMLVDDGDLSITEEGPMLKNRPVEEEPLKAVDSDKEISEKNDTVEITPTADKNTDEMAKDTDDEPSPKSNVRSLFEWIIKPVASVRGVCVEGKQSKSANEEFWKSSVIKERINTTTVETSSGSRYKLVGKIDKVYALEEGFSKKLVKSFERGFPIRWKELIAEHFDGTEKQEKSEIQGTEKMKMDLKTPVNIRKTQDQIVVTPEGQFVDLSSLHTTRSGRMVKPPLFWWMGQHLEINDNKVEISTLTPHAKDYIQGVAHQYSTCKPRQRGGWKLGTKLDRSYNIKQPKLNKSRNMTMSENSGSGINIKTSSLDKAKCKKGLKENVNKPKKAKAAKNVDLECSDRENMDLEKNIEEIIKSSKMNRLQPKPKRNTCYGKKTRSSTEDKDQESGGVSDVYTISDDETTEHKSRKGRQAKRSKKQPQNSYRDKRSKDSLDESKTDKIKTATRRSERRKEDLSESSQNENEDSDVRVTRSRRSATRGQSCRSGTADKNRSKTSNTSNLKVTRSQSVEHQDSSEAGTKMEDKQVVTHSSNSRSSRSRQTAVDSSDGNHHPKKSRSKTRSKRKKHSMSREESDSDDFSQRTGTVKKNRTVSVLPDKHKSDSTNQTKNSNWTTIEVKRLHQAVNSIRVDHPEFWEQVQKKVKTRTKEECQDRHWSEIGSMKRNTRQPSKEKKSLTSGSGKVQLTAKVGTMKRKQQLRDLMEQQNEGYEDNLFDATPFRNHSQSRVPLMGDKSGDEDKLFEELAKRNSYILNRIHTPVTRVNLDPVSEKKTPRNPLISPNEPVNRQDADRYIHKFLKRRRLANHQKKSSKTLNETDGSKIPNRPSQTTYNKDRIPTPTKKLFDVSRESVGSLLNVDEKSDSDNHVDSDEGSDYYWSDMDEK